MSGNQTHGYDSVMEISGSLWADIASKKMDETGGFFEEIAKLLGKTLTHLGLAMSLRVCPTAL